jgi:hypothetical protein
MKLRMLKYPRFAYLAWSVLALHVPAQNRNNIAFNLLRLRLYAKLAANVSSLDLELYKIITRKDC